MRSYTRGGVVIGIIGLLWFVFFAGTGIYCLLDPVALREYSAPQYKWTDREILIGAACYIVVGLAGLVVAFSRLFMPLLGRKR